MKGNVIAFSQFRIWSDSICAFRWYMHISLFLSVHLSFLCVCFMIATYIPSISLGDLQSVIFSLLNSKMQNHFAQKEPQLTPSRVWSYLEMDVRKHVSHRANQWAGKQQKAPTHVKLVLECLHQDADWTELWPTLFTLTTLTPVYLSHLWPNGPKMA